MAEHCLTCLHMIERGPNTIPLCNQCWVEFNKLPLSKRIRIGAQLSDTMAKQDAARVASEFIAEIKQMSELARASRDMRGWFGQN